MGSVPLLTGWLRVRRLRSRWGQAGWRGTSPRSNQGLFRPCDLSRINLTAYVRMMSGRGRRQIRCINITKDYCQNQEIQNTEGNTSAQRGKKITETPNQED